MIFFVKKFLKNKARLL